MKELTLDEIIEEIKYVNRTVRKQGKNPNITFVKIWPQYLYWWIPHPGSSLTRFCFPDKRRFYFLRGRELTLAQGEDLEKFLQDYVKPSLRDYPLW